MRRRKGGRMKMRIGLFLLWLGIAAATAADGAEAHPVKVVLFPFREAEIVARIDGTVQKHHFRVGEHFGDGALLVKIDDTRYKIELERAEARAEEAKLQAKLAREIYVSQKELFEQEFQSKLELQKREAEAASADARQRIADADVNEAEMLLGYCSVSAPFAGKLERIHCREYENVRIGQPLIKIIDDASLLAVMNMPLSELRPVGTPLTMSFRNGAAEVNGKILEIAPQADHRSGTIEVKVLVANDSGALVPGMTGVWRPEKNAEAADAE